jgi:uncharacterized protein (DUF58 family)
MTLDRPVAAALELALDPGVRPVQAVAADDLCEALEGGPPPHRVALVPGRAATVPYRVVPRVRGEHALGPVHLRVDGPLGLAARTLRVDLPGRVKIYPDMGPAATAEALRLRGVARAGTRSVRALGASGEFESLRDFQPGDDPRHLDWKSSRRRGRLTWRNRAPERQREVLLLVETGRLMTARRGERERLDASVRAAALLAWTVSRNHDSVGVVTFAATVAEALRPAAGPAALGRVREALLRVRSEVVEPDFRAAFARVHSLLGKRALVLLFSDAVGTAMASEIRDLCRATGRRHLVALVTLRDPEAFERAAAPADGPASLFRRAAAEAAVDERAAALAGLRREGVIVVDASPAGIGAAAVEAYLRVKERGLL